MTATVHVPVSRSVPCAICGVPAGERCHTVQGSTRKFEHDKRVVEAHKKKDAEQ